MSDRGGKSGSIIKRFLKRWFIDALGAMALGLFSSLIIGLIFEQLAKIPYLDWLSPFAVILKNPVVVGAAIGVAVANGLKSAPLAIYTSAAVGAFGYALGGPVGSYVAVLVGAEIGSLIAGKTRLDIVLVPFVTMVSGGLTAQFIGPPVSAFMTSLGDFINMATTLQPIFMGIIVSVVVGMVLTAPISSAALCIMLQLSGLAAGAATIGCCVNMVGFAIISYRDNGIGGFIAQGFGTSMLQVPNIVKKPVIWLPVILSSAILGPISTTLVQIINNPYGAGMGTSGLVGPINAYIVLSESGMTVFGNLISSPAVIIAILAVMLFVLPALLTYLIYIPFFKAGIIKKGDMALYA